MFCVVVYVCVCCVDDVMSVLINFKFFFVLFMGKKVVVKFKWGMEYCGFLVLMDVYMNL